jgi:hypothetical protein
MSFAADENASMLKRNDCHYHQGGEFLRSENDRLLPLICEMDALFPSVYQFYNSDDPSKTAAQQAATLASNEAYVYSMVAEAVRLRQLAATKCTARVSAARLVYAYTWHRYHDGKSFLSASDLRASFEQAYLAGADGNVMWGSEPTTMPQFEAWYKSAYAPLVNSWDVPPAAGRAVGAAWWVEPPLPPTTANANTAANRTGQLTNFEDFETKYSTSWIGNSFGGGQCSSGLSSEYHGHCWVQGQISGKRSGDNTMMLSDICCSHLCNGSFYTLEGGGAQN